jgi:hypothetical protein
MTMLHVDDRDSRAMTPAKHETKIFQTKFTTGDIPLPVELLHRMATRIKYPYPPQVVVIGMMFPVPVPSEFLAGMNVKPAKI